MEVITPEKKMKQLAEKWPHYPSIGTHANATNGLVSIKNVNIHLIIILEFCQFISFANARFQYFNDLSG
uniref:Uncharacterized protein n=1 Tax=Panagrolaimus sp. JU765 TaxID=591449 RepID=A0AC34QHT8_9BILA